MKINLIPRSLLLAALCLAGTMQQVRATEPEEKPYWQDIQTVSVNREEPRTDFMTFSDRLARIL